MTVTELINKLQKVKNPDESSVVISASDSNCINDLVEIAAHTTGEGKMMIALRDWKNGSPEWIGTPIL